MKRKFLLLMLALIAMATTARSQVVLNETNFPDANFRAALATILKISEGDEITEAKIAATTSLKVNSKSIADLTGIEHFTALTDLECYNNQLTSLDMSKNTALKYLSCSDNQLTALDVSNNTALQTLYCYGNQLTSLDMSNNTALTYLSCYNNQLTLLDVSKNTALTYLYCYNNPLTTLDVSQNTALTDLYCHNNQLTALDVSQNTALTSLACSGNQLTALDVSKNIKLWYLYCDNNQLTSLDVSKNTKLWYLWCHSNQIKGEAMDALVASLPTVTSGEFIVIDTKDENEGNVCTKSQVAVAKGKGWTVYDLNGGNRPYPEYEGSDDAAAKLLLNAENFPDANFRAALAKILGISEGDEITEEKIAATTSIDVNGYFKADNIKIADLKGIEYFTALKVLVCYNNQLTSLDVSKNTALTSLHCFSNQIKGEAMDALVASLPTVESGSFYVINTKDENEGNICTKAQVAVAKEKGWKVYDYNGSWDDCQKYEGSDDVLLLDDDNFPDDNFRNAIAKELGLSVGSEINEGLIVATIKLDVSDGKITELSGIEYFTALTTIYCQINQISDKAMTSLIGALPDLSGNEAKGLMLTEETNPRKGTLYALDFTDENEQNVCTAEHVAAANAKGWTVYCKTANGWQEYNGEIPTGINTVDSGELADDSWYTIDGKKLASEPKEKGIYIRNGRKVVK